jgi:hypothetical protein
MLFRGRLTILTKRIAFRFFAGAWGAGYGSVPLALSQKVPEIEHVLTESNPQYILLGGNCHLHSGALHAAQVPPNAYDLLQAVENL